MDKKSDNSGNIFPYYRFVGIKYLKLLTFLKYYLIKEKNITHIGRPLPGEHPHAGRTIPPDIQPY
jgi:hypothetical protein